MKPLIIAVAILAICATLLTILVYLLGDVLLQPLRDNGVELGADRWNVVPLVVLQDSAAGRFVEVPAQLPAPTEVRVHQAHQVQRRQNDLALQVRVLRTET